MPDALTSLLLRARSTPGDPVVRGAGACDATTLLGRVAAVAAALQPGSTVGVLAEDGADWFVAALAARAAGITMVPLPLFFHDSQLGHVMRDAGVGAIMASASQTARAAALGCAVLGLDGRAPWSGLADRGGRLIAYTSGTTGAPKGVVLDAGSIDTKALTLMAAVGAGNRDLHLSMLPMSLLLEQVCAIHVVLLAGASVAIGPRGPAGWSVAALAEIEALAPTVCVVVPALLQAWVDLLEAAGRRAPLSLRFVAAGGATVAPGLAERAWRLGLPVHEGYGLTECCSVVCLNRPGRRRAGTVGEPLPGVRVAIEAGEVVVDDPSLMAGYLGRGPGPRRWATGDTGRFDADGRLVVLGRLDDVIVTSLGRNIAPGWPESLVLAEPAIAHAVVLPGGSHPEAVVEPTRDGIAAAASAVERAWRQLPDYARPRRTSLEAPGTFRRMGWLRPDGAVDRRAVAASRADADSQDIAASAGRAS